MISRFAFAVLLSALHLQGLPALSFNSPAFDRWDNSGVDTLARPHERYNQATLVSQYLFNGSRYHLYDRMAETHQFYKSRDPFPGSLSYDGQHYGPFEMLYDVNFDQLVIKHPTNGFLVRLDPAKIEEFTLDGDYFQPVSGHPELKSGFYQTLYDQGAKLICRRQKTRIEKIIDFKTTTIFYDADEFFLYHQGQYIKIRRKKDLYFLFPEHKNKIRTYFRREYTNFKTDMERHLLHILQNIDLSGSGA